MDLTICFKKYNKLREKLMKKGLSIKEFCEQLPSKEAETLRTIQRVRNEYAHSTGKPAKQPSDSVLSTWIAFLESLLAKNF